jgi:hypothetical protein
MTPENAKEAIDIAAQVRRSSTAYEQMLVRAGHAFTSLEEFDLVTESLSKAHQDVVEALRRKRTHLERTLREP